MAFSIRELETLSGVKAHTIRIWEQRYHFLKPSRTLTNIRTYSNEELKTLLTVSLLNKYGYKISHIDEMLPEQRIAAALKLPQTDAQIEFEVNELIGYMIDLKNIEFENVLNNYIQVHGISETVTTIVFQFLEKVGILWQTDHINPAHEHIVSNIVRQKIISGIDSLPAGSQQNQLFLLFLPEDEYHELGLLFIYYLLKRKRIRILYLGASVPVKDVHYVVRVKHPQALYLHLTSFPRQLQFEKYLHQLVGGVPNASILISGGITKSYSKKIPPNITLLKTLQEVQAYINSL